MKKLLATAVLAVSAAAPGLAADPALPVEKLRAVAAEVSETQLKDTIERLVGFGTRHTLSSKTDEKRGIGAAQRWTAAKFAEFAQACNGCLTIETPTESFTGNRLPGATEITDVLAIQKGSSDPDRVIIISGHIDSRVTDPMDAEHDAPGANDDGSGTAAVIEAARVLSKHQFPATLVYAVLTGEEQGLFGGQVLAHVAKAKGWRVEAQLNNDIIGNIEGINGKIDSDHFRIFSEGTRAAEEPAEVARRRLTGGEIDSPSRNLARLVAEVTDAVFPSFHPKQIYRADRFSRGGDQLPMQEAGYTAIRLVESAENYHRQHQDLRYEDKIAYGDVVAGVNFPYLAKMTKVNVAAMADLAWAPPPPSAVKIDGAISADTTLSWDAIPGAAGYRVRWRPTDAARWDNQRAVGTDTKVTLKDLVIDDWAFGVAALSAEGFVSPTRFANGK